MHYRAALLLCAAATACSLGLEVPSGTTITCQSQNECPDGFVCQTSLSRCVPLGYDVTPPALSGSPTITPSIVGAGGEVSISFSTTKSLGLEPVVTLVFGPTIQKSAHKVSASSDSTEYVFAYTTDSTEPQTSASVVILITDVAGNQGSSETPDAVRFDFVAPTLFASATKVTLTPPAGSILPLAETTAVAVGGTVTLSLQSDEVLAADSRVVVDGADLAFVQSSVLGTAYVYTLQFAGGASDGAHALTFEAVDAAGNRSTTPVGSIIIDTTPPATPLTATQDKIVYRRSPWGADPATRFTVSGAAGAFEADINVAVLDANDASARVLQRGVAGADGALLALALPELDRQRVYVQAYDTAGNASPVQLVQDVDWVGGFDPVGLATPHAAFAFQAERRGLVTSAAERLDITQLRALGSADADPAAWKQIDLRRPWVKRDSTSERGHFFYSSAYDSRRGEIVTFGGQLANVTAAFGTQDFAIWNGEWRTPTSLGALPDARYGHAMAYDSYRDRVVLYGGQSGTGVFDDTWEWDGERWTKLPISGPGGISFHGMAFDSINGRVVLYGGCFDAICDDVSFDTWAFDGTSWQPLPVTNPPGQRYGHSLTEYGGGLVLFGGCPAGNGYDPTSTGSPECGSYLGDRWLLSGTTWSNISDGTEPSPRAFHTAVWDQADNLYIYGGSPFSIGNADGQVWASDGSDFFVAFDPARPATGATGAYHQGLGKVVYFGGIYDADMDYLVLQDVVSIAGAGFAPASSLGTPAVRVNGGFGFSPALNALVQSGGGTVLGGVNRGESMSWNGSGWTPLGTNLPDTLQSGCADGARGAGVSAFDGFRNRMVTLCANRTYELNGSSWGEVCTLAGCRGTLPAGTSGYAMAYDSSARRILTFGGGSNNATSATLFGYNGTAWSTLCSAGVCNPPPARRCAGMVYDAARSRTVMFGGGHTYCEDPFDSDFSSDGAALNDTWEWNQATTSWTPVCTAGTCAKPPTRHDALLVYDTNRTRVVLYGAGYGDIWEWNGVHWIQRLPEGLKPSPRRAPVIGYDPNRQVLAMFGGRDEDANNELWELDLNPEQRPALMLDFDWTTAGVPRTSVRSVHVHVRAGGHGNTNDTSLGADNDTIGEPKPGAQLEEWMPSTDWYVLQSTGADVNAVGDIDLTSASNCGDPLLNRDGHIYARVAPSWGDGNGEVPASLVVDEADVTVRYTIGRNGCP